MALAEVMGLAGMVEMEKVAIEHLSVTNTTKKKKKFECEIYCYFRESLQAFKRTDKILAVSSLFLMKASVASSASSQPQIGLTRGYELAFFFLEKRRGARNVCCVRHLDEATRIRRNSDVCDSGR